MHGQWDNCSSNPATQRIILKIDGFLNGQFLDGSKFKKNIKLSSKGGLLEESLMYELSIYSKFGFSRQRTESQSFCKEGNWVSHCKKLAQVTPFDSKTEKDSS